MHRTNLLIIMNGAAPLIPYLQLGMTVIEAKIVLNYLRLNVRALVKRKQCKTQNFQRLGQRKNYPWTRKASLKSEELTRARLHLQAPKKTSLRSLRYFNVETLAVT